MRNQYGRLAAFARMAMAVAVALAVSTPASAQFGGLKKKLKGAAAQEGASKAAGAAGVTPEASAEAEVAGGGAGGGTVVLTEEVVAQLLTGLKAGQAVRAAARKEDTPYGRYQKAQAAFADAEPKCQAAQQSFPQRMANNQKMMDKYSALVDKMVDAQGKGNQKLAAVYQDSAMAMQDPSCTIKRPEQPENSYEAQRDINNRAEQQEIKASRLTRSELAMVKERAEGILRGAPPADASAGEKSAVSAKAGELKSLLGIRDQPAVRAAKAAPAPAPAAPAAPAAPTMSPAASSMNDCMMKNLQAHQAELEALGKRAEAAKNAGNNGKMMAIVDTVQQIQMAGCR